MQFQALKLFIITSEYLSLYISLGQTLYNYDVGGGYNFKLLNRNIVTLFFNEVYRYHF